MSSPLLCLSICRYSVVCGEIMVHNVVYGEGGRGGLNLCVNLVGGCVDSAVRKILLPRKIFLPHCHTTPPLTSHIA